jgi:two-component system KDP operon response regulator KdpE
MTAELPLVLVAEDEANLRSVLCTALESNAYRCIAVGTVKEALSESENRPPDLLIADLGLPDRNGIELINRIRQWSTLPIIVLSARSQESDKVLALDAGADDYVTKPFSTAELFARMRVALRHASARGRGEGESIYVYKDLRVDLTQRRVTVGGDEVHLTPIEFRLLSTLVRKSGQVVTHAELLCAAWGPGKVEQHHYPRIYMAGLRRKLEEDPARPVYLLTEVGVGYRLACDLGE